MKPITHLLLAFLCITLLAPLGCGDAPTPEPPPPPPVTVDTPVVQTVTRYFEYRGNTIAINQVDVVARVPGTLIKQNYELIGEDNRVKRVEKDDVLFEIEHEPYEIAVASAEAEVKRAEASEAAAKSIFESVKRSFDRNASTDLELTKAEADYKQSTAERLATEARLAQAELDLSYTYVKSPIAGEVSRNLVDVGTYVGGGGATVLTRVTQTKPIYVYFDVSEDIVLKHIARVTERGQDYAEEPPPIDVATGADSGGGWSHTGVVDWWDRTVDRGTGTIVVRGRLENEDGSLVPGLTVRVRAPFEQIEDAVLVREEAIGTDLSGKFVLAVVQNEQNQPVVKRQPITLVMRGDNGLYVVDGLPPDTQYITGGIQKVRPGMVVNPTKAGQAKPAQEPEPTPEPDIETEDGPATPSDGDDA